MSATDWTPPPEAVVAAARALGSFWHDDPPQPGDIEAARAVLAAAHPALVAAASMTPVPSKGTGKEIVRLAEPVRQKLRERAEAEGVSKSEIMRRAIYKELGVEDE